MNSRLSSEQVKAEAHALGFSACGLAEAGPVDGRHSAAFTRWIADGAHAGMQYMERNADKRLDPQQLMPDVKSIVSVALNYTPGKRACEGGLKFAAYALGNDIGP